MLSDTQFTVTDLFELLRSSELLQQLVEKLEVQLSDEAVVKYLAACAQAIDDDEDDRRILKDAIFVLENNWKPDQKRIAALGSADVWRERAERAEAENVRLAGVAAAEKKAADEIHVALNQLYEDARKVAEERDVAIERLNQMEAPT